MASVSVCIWLLVLFLLCSMAFSFSKVVFMIRSSMREKSERDERISELVEQPGFNESISIGRITCNLGAGLVGYLLVWKLLVVRWPAIVSHHVIFLVAYIICAAAFIYVVTVFLPNLLGLWKSGALSVLFLFVYSWIRLPIAWASKLANVVYTKLLALLGYDPKLDFLSEEQRDAIQGDMTEAKDDALEEDEKQMILNIFDFVETPVREIMTPRVDMCAIDVNTSLEKTIQILNGERHSRLPVYRDSIDNIVGVLSNRDFLEWYTSRAPDEPFDLEKLVMPAIFVSYYKKIDDLLTELRRNGNQLAMVVDEYGGTAGLVTVEDILEEIVGEIRDEDDDEEDEDVQKLKDGRYILDPLVTLSDLEYELGVEFSVPEHSHVETLSGLIQATLGSIPVAGTEVEIDGYRFRVLKVDGTRMEKVLMIAPKKEEGKKK